MNNKSLAVLEPQTLTELKGVAQIFAESGMFGDARGMAQAFVKIMAGREAGFGAFASMQNVNIIQGKPSFNAQMMAAAVKRHEKYDYRVKSMTDDVCAIAFYQDGEIIGESTFTMDDAKAAKVTGNNTWQKYPRNMLFARALSNGVRWYCPDVFSMSVYTADELGEDETPQDFDPDNPGEIINSDIVEPPAKPDPAPSPFPERAPRGTSDDPPEERDAERETPPAAQEQLFVTIGDLWPNLTGGLLNMAIRDLPDSVNIGAIVYPKISELGYENAEHMKRALGVKSSKDFRNGDDDEPGSATLADLLGAIINSSPKYAIGDATKRNAS